MSDYVHKIAIRYKLSKEFLDKYTDPKYEDIDAIQIEKDLKLEDFNEKYKDKNYKFDLSYGYNYDRENKDDRSEHYIDITTYYTYGEDCGDYAFSKYLNRTETNEFFPIFKKMFPEINKRDLRRVNYCYYNGSDAPACYDTDEEFDEPMDRRTLCNWFISSVENSKWTEDMIDELLKDFEVYPKREGEYNGRKSNN